MNNSLPITRESEENLGDFPAVEKYSEGLERVRTKSWWSGLPGGKEVLVKREMWVTNQYGVEITHTVEEWEYRTVYSPPDEYIKLTYARLWLPGRSRRTTMGLVDRVRTVFWSSSVYASTSSNELSYRTVREGVVIYRVSSTKKAPTEEDIELAKDQGRQLLASMGDEDDELGGEPPGGPDPTPEDEENDLQLDSVQTWDQALERSTIIEKENSAVRTMWKQISIEDHRVEETWSHIITWTVKKDLLRPGKVDVQGPEYESKVAGREEISVPLDPPNIESLFGISDAVRADVKGGGAVWVITFPRFHKIPIQPEKYRLYRRLISRPERTQPDDIYGIYATDPETPIRLNMRVDETGVETVAGVPTSSLPASVPDTEPADEDPNPDEIIQWTLIAEALNEETARWADGYASFADRESLETGATYEYVATCVVGDTESPYSEPKQIEYNGTSSGLTGVRVKIKDGDGFIELDIAAPEDVEAADDLGEHASDLGDYGETLIYDVPLGLDSDRDDAKDWEEELEEIGKVIGTANLVRDNGVRKIQILPTIPLLNLRRGMYITIPAVAWTTTGNSLVISSEVVPSLARVDGYSFTFKASDNGTFSVSPGAISATLVTT